MNITCCSGFLWDKASELTSNTDCKPLGQHGEILASAHQLDFWQGKSSRNGYAGNKFEVPNSL